MTYRIPLVLALTPLLVVGGLVGAGFLGAGCSQPLDKGLSAGSAPPPPNPIIGANLSQQCEAGSALCYQLCLSPECAIEDDAGNVVIPPVAQTPAVVLPDGTTSADPCADIDARVLKIRQQACAQCHDTGGPGAALWHFVLDDHALETTVPTGLTAPLVVPGDPASSVLLQKVQLGITGGALGMPPSQALATSDVSAQVAATIVYPTPEDASLVYSWILNCVPGTDGGAYSPTNYYGGNYGPPPGGGGTGAGGTGAGGTGAGGTGAGGTGARGTGGSGGSTASGSGGTGGMAAGGAGAGATPCTGLCPNPVTFTVTPPQYSGTGFGLAAVCDQTTSTLTGFNCGNAGGRRVSINGTTVDCASGSPALSTIPSRNGGYCFRATAATSDLGFYFTAF